MRFCYSLLFTATLAFFATAGCQRTQQEPAPTCDTPATIQLARLDGCGPLLMLDSGKLLEPRGELWQNFAKHQGQRVTISYAADQTGGLSVCMAGASVVITCIQ